ncbi:high nitrogen upregulated cytochrome P450 monooxygenase 2 [Coprinopsis cinerea okayama7|uniref:High nitrogen upregulated cytochrome P450 monooxygenase 2 n=1 Tax=Coprinopsis cinerea (strain Okayama-7 / 130 / ATCC MYA-4618 / FGSC 9003) TaxID=240176 RepID=A8NJE0_COPC7|nr:high nitrogen upregulated cytochrome P450 monooxygenase 2 [Coprinopsis cinerea okayama7\|eukprot:XP_001834203.2 high nitrogen upregulated cytochrome P450 monooxygenase 2 [Coprinopsis cinerea okayama7\
MLVPHVSSVPLAIGLAFLIFFSTLFSSIVLYRVSPLHPLAGYPGPLLWRITKFAPAWYGHKGKHHIQLKKLHERYGPIVRIGPNELSIVDKDLIPFILGAQGMPKGPLWEGRRILPSKNYNVNNSLVAVRDLERHAQLRKPWNKAFGTGPLKDYEEMLVVRAGLLMDRLEGHCKAARDKIGRVDLAKWVSFFAFDFMGDIAFASDFSLLQDGDVNGFIKNMEDAHYLPTIVQHIPWMAKVTRVTPWVGSKLQKFGAFALAQARKRAATTMMHKDLFYHLIQATDPDLAASPLPLIMANAILTIIAGSDTSASAVTSIIYFLLRNPECHKKLQKEIDDTFGFDEGDPAITPDKLAQLPYLNAVINEAMRVFPPVASSVQRAPKIGSGGKMVGSMFIPEGTSVTVPPYVYHRDPRYFSPNPDTFWPERWLVEGDGKIVHERGAFIPFSAGPANCAGKPLALMEIRYVTSLLIRTFDMSLDENFDPVAWENSLTDRLVLCKGPLPVNLTRRSTSS